MDYYELMVIGTGGRGVLLLGRLLAEAGMEKYKYSMFFPNYAPAMRGGESECTIILSNNYVNSPVRFNPDFALAMTGSALDLIRERVKSGGTLMVDSSVMPDKVERDDINVLYVPATERAVALGGNQAANMVLLGAYLEYTKALPIPLVEKALDNRLPGEAKKAILSLNKTALNNGAKFMTDYRG